jgi:hydroxyacylglutathione hydrolase
MSSALPPRTFPPLRLMPDPEVYLVASGGAGLQLSHPVDCNSYLIARGGQTVLIDAGAGPWAAERVEALCRDRNLALPRHLMLTHGHADHSGGAAEMVRRWPGLQVWAGAALVDALAHLEDPVSLERARRAGVYPEDYRWEPPPIHRPLAGGERLALADLELEAVATPGHAAEHVVYRLTGGSGPTVLFSGDHLYPGGRVALQPIPGCDVLAHAQSMHQVAALPHEALLAGHLMPVLQDGGRSARLAAARFARLAVPHNLGDVWEADPSV